MRMTRMIVAIIVVVSIGVLSLDGFICALPKGLDEMKLATRSNLQPSRDVTFPVHVSVTRAGDLVMQLAAYGVLRARQAVDIRALVGGTLTLVQAYNGKEVMRGERLAVIDDHEFRLAYERTRTDLLNAQIEYQTLSANPFLASTDSSEIQQIVAGEAASLDSLTQAYLSSKIDEESFERMSRDHEAVLAYLTAERRDVIAGRSGLVRAREAHEIAKRQLERTSVRAPFDGFVADCYVSPGMCVEPGQTLMRLCDLSAFFVDVEILETEVSTVAVGRRAQIVPVGLPGWSIPGSVISVNPLVDLRTRTVKATIALDGKLRRLGPQPPALVPGMFASVLLETEVHSNRLIVPSSAVLVRDERSLVFKVQRGFAKWCYVETGARNGEEIEIIDGLRAGDTVIVDGHFTLAHDARVAVIGHIE